jgi:hypothetical protein
MAFMDTGFFSLAYGTRGPGFASGANKISKQRRFGIVTEPCALLHLKGGI